MTRCVFKYLITIADEQALMMPMKHRFLTAQFQGGSLCLWAEVEPGTGLRPVTIRIFGTGNPLPDEPGEYIATAQQYDGALVWHVYAERA